MVYYPFGNGLGGKTPALQTDKLYTSQRLDFSTNLYFYNARYYNPKTGRFISADSAQGPNRYAYVGNNPVMNNDPSGNAICQGEQCNKMFPGVYEATEKFPKTNKSIESGNDFLKAFIAHVVTAVGFGSMLPEDYRAFVSQKLAVGLAEGSMLPVSNLNSASAIDDMLKYSPGDFDQAITKRLAEQAGEKSGILRAFLLKLTKTTYYEELPFPSKGSALQLSNGQLVKKVQVVNVDLSPQQKLLTLIHEGAHNLDSSPFYYQSELRARRLEYNAARRLFGEEFGEHIDDMTKAAGAGDLNTFDELFASGYADKVGQKRPGF